MNAKLLAGHAVVATICSAAWEVTVAMPSGPTNPVLALAGLAPYAFAGVSLMLIAAGEGRREPEQPQTLPAQRRAVAAPRRRELTR